MDNSIISFNPSERKPVSQQDWYFADVSLLLLILIQRGYPQDYSLVLTCHRRISYINERSMQLTKTLLHH